MVADATATTVWRWDQAEPFGNNPADEDPDGNAIAFDLPLRLPGQRYDKETNLAYNYFRDYDPAIGRYIQSDPIGLKGGLNTFLYVNADPLLRLDPLGLYRTTGSVAPATANTIVCDGSGNIVSQIQPLDPLNRECIGDCMLQHEESHRRDALLENAKVCVGKPKGTQIYYSNTAQERTGEVKGSEIELACLSDKLNPYKCDKCYPIILERIKQIEAYRDRYK